MILSTEAMVFECEKKTLLSYALPFPSARVRVASVWIAALCKGGFPGCWHERTETVFSGARGEKGEINEWTRAIMTEEEGQ